jgi:hypothetical protein
LRRPIKPAGGEEWNYCSAAKLMGYLSHVPGNMSFRPQALTFSPTERFPMKIAQIAPLMESVPPRLYGGTERVVSYLGDSARAARRRAFPYRGRRGGIQLFRSRRQDAANAHRIRADTDTFVAFACFVPARSGTAQVYFALLHDLLRSRSAEGTAISEELAVSASRVETDNQGRNRDRNLQSPFQRSAAARDRGPRDPTDPHLARALPLCGNSMVFDHVRARRPDHGHAVPLARSAHSARCAHASRGLPGDRLRS